MSWRLIVGHQANRDWKNAVHWYDRETGTHTTGDRFLAILNETLAAIVANPQRFTPSPFGGRRALMDPFPHATHYIEVGNIVHVVAVWHQSRDPEKLRRRFRPFS